MLAIVGLARPGFFDYRQPNARRQLPHGCREIDMLVIHDKSKNASAGAAAKTMKRLPLWINCERGCFFLMKRAERLESGSGAFQREVRTDDLDDVIRGRNLF